MEWNLRVSAALHQGDRKYMEDQYAIHYECDKETGKFLYVYFGVFDGHGGADAAKYAKAHLHKNITANILFYSKDPNDVLKAIEEGFLKTHEDMWKEIGEWPTTATGLPSTAGTTASVVFIKDNQLYTGHVGDSGISIGMQSEQTLGKGQWVSEHLTVDHKPDSPAERKRIENMGGKVVPKAGVPRVVWERPRESGPDCKPDQVDHIPFLAVGRSLGDLWSYNQNNQQYAISPKPDVEVMRFDPFHHKCLVLASDGLWNLLDHNAAVTSVEMTDRKWFREAIYEKGNGIVGFPKTGDPYYHHASTLVNVVLRKWRAKRLRADNSSAIVVMLDPPGQPVHESLSKLSSIAACARNRGERFCARAYLKENEESLSACEKYILAMTGSYNMQYYEDRDRFELHFGEPSVRYNVAKGCDTSQATSSIAMYDVIIHKVMTPSKTTDNVPARPSNQTFSKLRRTQSCKELKRFRPKSDTFPFASFLDEDRTGDPGPEELMDKEEASPPSFLSFDESKSAEDLNADSQSVQPGSPQESHEKGASKAGPEIEVVVRASPDSTSATLSSSSSAAKVPAKKNTILRCLKGVARSLTSLTDKPAARCSSVKADSTTRKGMKLRRGRKPGVVAGSPAKKRHAPSVDSLAGKRLRLSAPCVQLTKISTVTSAAPESRICLRPRLK